MADPTDPTQTPNQTTPDVASPTQEQIGAWQNLERATASYGVSLDNVGGVSNAVNSIFLGLNTTLAKAGTSFESLTRSGEGLSRQAAALTTSFLGAREAFTQITNVDPTKMVSTMDQLRELADIIRTGPGTAAAAGAIEGILGKMVALGASSQTVAKAQEELKKGVVGVAAAFFNSADNVKRLQQSLIQMTISGGGLQTLLKSVGSDFQNIDNVTAKYAATLSKATTMLGGTKAAQERAANYMAVINQMPGGLDLLTKKTEIAGKQTDLLSETIAIAAASGRKEEEVLQDINHVLTTYKSVQDDANITAGAAATLTARMATIASNLGANIKDVHSALMESTDAFKMYVMDGANVADMTRGMAEAMENYTGSLEAVGVPAANAIEMFKNYTSVMKGMNLGQQAFLSTMSGGPGGLRGAFQVQDAIAKGDFEKLRQQVEGAVKKVGGGRIASREEAMQSEAGAAVYARQIQTLQQGPLGSLARTIPEAEALLKAMKAGKGIGDLATAKVEDPTNAMRKAVDVGNKIQKDSYSVLVDINAGINNLVLSAGLTNRKTEREVLGTKNTGAYGGGVGGTGAGINPNPGVVGPSNDALKAVADVAMNLPKTMRDAWRGLQDVMTSGNKQSIKDANDKMVAAIKENQEAQANMTTEQRAAFNTAQQAFGVASPGSTTTTSAGAQMPTPSTGTPRSTTQQNTPKVVGQNTQGRLVFSPTGTTTRAAQNIPAPLSPSNTGTTTTPASGGAARQPGIGGGAPGQAVPVTLAPGSAITVNFTGACPHCGGNIRHNTNGTVAPQADNHNH